MAGFKLPVEPKSRRARSESHCAFLSEMRDREGGTSSESEAALGFTSAANSEMLPQPKPRRIRDHSIFIPSSNELGQRDSFLHVRILAMSDYKFGGQHYDYCVCPVCRKAGGDHHALVYAPPARAMAVITMAFAFVRSAETWVPVISLFVHVRSARNLVDSPTGKRYCA